MYCRYISIVFVLKIWNFRRI